MIPPLVAEGRAVELAALSSAGIRWDDYTGREEARKTSAPLVRTRLARADALYWKWLLLPAQDKLLARVARYWAGRLGLAPDDARTLVMIAAHRALLRWDDKRGGYSTVLRLWARATLGRGRADERCLSGGRGAATCGKDPTRGLMVLEPLGAASSSVERRPTDDTPADLALCMASFVKQAKPEDRVLLGLLVDGAGLREVAQALGVSMVAAKARVTALEAEVRAALV